MFGVHVSLDPFTLLVLNKIHLNQLCVALISK